MVSPHTKVPNSRLKLRHFLLMEPLQHRRLCTIARVKRKGKKSLQFPLTTTDAFYILSSTKFGLLCRCRRRGLS